MLLGKVEKKKEKYLKVTEELKKREGCFVVLSELLSWEICMHHQKSLKTIKGIEALSKYTLYAKPTPFKLILFVYVIDTWFYIY